MGNWRTSVQTVFNTYSQRIAWSYEKCFSANDHVTIAVTIKCSTHVIVTAFNRIDQIFGICKIWIGM